MCLDQFRDGLKELGFLEAAIAFPMNYEKFFVPNDDDLTPEKVKSIISLPDVEGTPTMLTGAAWPTGTPGDFPVGHQKFVACGPSRQAIFSPISLVKIDKLFVISAPASLILIFTYGAIKAKERFLNHEKIYKDFACFDPRRFNELKQVGIPSSATSKVSELL